MAESDSSAPADNAVDPVDPQVHWTAARLSGYCLVALAILYTLYFARSLLMPIVVAALFSLMLSPWWSCSSAFVCPASYPPSC